MEQAVLQEKLTSSPFLAGASLPPEQVTAKRFRAGQIISDRPGGVSSVVMIVSGRVEDVYKRQLYSHCQVLCRKRDAVPERPCVPNL